MIFFSHLGHLGEVPAIPFPDSHGIRIELLVEIIQESDGLYNHRVDLAGGGQVIGSLTVMAGQRKNA